MQSQKNIQPYFSIVIPSLNEEKLLPLLLEDLANQSFAEFEVIHVDAGSTDDTVKKTKSFSQKLALKTIISKKKNVSHQRNLGITASQGSWIIFMDADNRLPSYFLEGIKYNLVRDPSTDIFTTLIDTDGYSLQNKPIVLLTNILLEFLSHIRPSGPGALIGVRTAIAQKFPFDTTVKLSEDHLFIEKIVQHNYSFACFKDPKYHYSLRRMEKNGTLKTMQINAKIYLKFFLNMDINSDAGIYPMDGGTLYEKENVKQLRTLEKIYTLNGRVLPFTLLKKLIKSISQ